MDLGESHPLANGALVWLEDQNVRHIVICYSIQMLPIEVRVTRLFMHPTGWT